GSGENTTKRCRWEAIRRGSWSAISGVRPDCKPVTLVLCREIGGEKPFLRHDPPVDVGEHYF
ncbi:MAG: hypothetical protein RBS57_00950, partial [Desulforhabdus sp.]|nr:hypothetical protein [Desulforhabdus sp.]